MTDRPILFSAPMVRALLAGRKTQTRRIASFIVPAGEQYHVRNAHGGWFGPASRVPEVAPNYAPYAVGDRLWVKETWLSTPAYDDLKPSELGGEEPLLYVADSATFNWREADGHRRGKTRVSIFMPRWASGQPSINARLETAATSRYWADIWSAGRCLLPADGWFEWVSDPRQPRARQPYFIRLKRDEPMFFAAVGRFTRGPDAIQPEDAGFAIVTADSEGGMIDVHDRRPVVLPADAARKWLAPHVSPAEAEDLACRHATPVDAFQWYEVDPAVGDVRSEGRQLIEPRPPIPSTMDMFDG